MKRIVICSDGTWCKADSENPSYVRRIYTHLSKQNRGVSQIGFYDEGVGTGSSKYVAGGFGIGLSQNIKDCYKFLVENYTLGDEIFLFGFSRGAYTVRSLAGLIRNCGILKPDKIDQIHRAFEIYRRKKYGPNCKTAKEFRYDNSVEDESPIHFLGVFDTVGALGIAAIGGWKSISTLSGFHDTELSHIVQHARHALSIDESRLQFPPTLWNNESAAEKGIDAKSVWFAGVHSDIGGTFQDTSLGDCAGEWMAIEAVASGLELQPSFWNTLGANPLGPINDPGFPKRPRRKIAPGSHLHQSVKIRHRQCKTYCNHKLLKPFYMPDTDEWNAITFVDNAWL